MGLFADLQAKLNQSGFWIVSVCALLSFYFGFYAVNGDRGLLKYLYLKQEIAEAKDSYGDYNHKKSKLEDKVRLLSNSSLDLDLLEERAMVVLNFAADDEFIILDNSDEDK